MDREDDGGADDRGYRVLGSHELSGLRDPERELAYAVLVGLSEKPKRISSRFFYDAEGSRLFERIMKLREYYLTECEREILTACAPALAEGMQGRPIDVVDLGAGDGEKTRILLGELAKRGVDFRYVPIDISEAAMRTVVAKMRSSIPGIRVAGVVAEYVDGVDWLAAHEAGRARVVLFLGSNVGNFDKPHARAFLRRMWTALRAEDHVLIGFDLKKDIDILLDAYNDSEGVTAAFNLNLLARINRELGGEFDLSRFRHFGTYDVFTGAMKSYLVSLEAQTVWIEGLRCAFQFDPWEPLHTEYSYKYLRNDIAELASDTGFAIESEHLDERGWFVDSLWRRNESGRPR